MGMGLSTMCEPEGSHVYDKDGQQMPDGSHGYDKDGQEAFVGTGAPVFSREDIANVQRTWAQAKALGAETVGRLVFKKIFELAPGALQLFSFRDEEPARLYEPGGRLEAHAVKVVGAIDSAVQGMHLPSSLLQTLRSLGLRHHLFKVKTEHYDVVNHALSLTLESALKSSWTDPVQRSWGKLLKLVKDEMVAGAVDADACQMAGAVRELHLTLDLESPEVDVAAPVDGRDVELVQHTWGIARESSNYSHLGRMLFKKIFIARPEAIFLFSFKGDIGPDLYDKGGRLDKHGIRVITALNCAVDLLGQQDALAPVLGNLGMRHGALGIVAEHYDIVAHAVVELLHGPLKKKYTTAVKNAWLKILTVVKNIMVGAADEASKLADAAAKEAVPPKNVAKKHTAKKKTSATDAKPAEAETDATAVAEAATEQATAAGTVDVKEAKKERLRAWKAMDSKTQTALAKKMLTAAQTGDAMTVEDCLKKNCDVDCFDASDANAPGETPLHFAVANGHAKIVKMLVEDYGAAKDVKVKMGEWGLSPLHYAARSGDKEIAKLCYDPKMAVDKNNYLKVTPAELAKKSDQKDMPDFLKKVGKDFKK